ncbi:t-SNARE [Fennellomyces sp. T-0311]|nr:t-SNARE [Fennellomyces sp. T-0311]
MSFAFSRDRTEEFRGSFEGRRSSDDFGPARLPAGYRSNNTPSPTSGRPINRTQSPPPPAPRHSEQYELSERPPATLSSLDGFLIEIDQLKKDLNSVNENIDAIERLHNSSLSTYNDDQWQYYANELDRLQSAVRTQNANIKKRIAEIERSNSHSNNPSEYTMRRQHSVGLRTRFMDTIRRYQDIESDYRQKYRHRVERQIRIVKPEATEAEIDQYMDSDQGTQIFSQSIMQSGRQGASRAVLSEVQSRHDDIRRIEKTLVELHQLFNDMSMLVERQGEVVVQIEQNAQTTAGELKEGNRAIKRAVELARSTRAKKWCCAVLVVVLCVVIAILVWWFAFDHPGVD